MASYVREKLSSAVSSAKDTLKSTMDKPHSAIQLIDGKGELDADRVRKFVKDVKLGPKPIDYVVVSIMGPQSSGKSTLMNNLFHTKFKEMEAADGRTQTTQGIWMDKCVDIQPFTIVMDLEGSDGSERQDDTTFEKQSALFALAVSDIVIINMWCNDFGREQAASKPLLRTVFQAMMRMFRNPGKTTLLFVLRDKSKIWNEVPKRANHKNTQLDEIFNVEVVALSSYERDEEMFKEEVAALRKRFVNSISPGGLAAGDRMRDVPASAFLTSIQTVWEKIKEDRDLDLPSHKVMLANIRCQEILDQQLSKLIQNKGWSDLKKSAENELVSGLGQSLSKLLHSCLEGYENEALYFDETIQISKRELLKSKVLEELHPAFTTTLGHLRKKVYEEFKSKLNASIDKGDELFESARTLTAHAISEFDKGTADAGMKDAPWDVSIVREKLRSDIEACAHSKHNDIRFKENANVIAELKKMDLQSREQSREQIKKIVEMTEAQQKAEKKYTEYIKKLEDLRAQDQEKINELMKSRTIDQAQLEKLQKSVAHYQRKLELRRKWGPFYFIRQLFRSSDDDDTGGADEDVGVTGKLFEDDAIGTGETSEVEATGNDETFEGDVGDDANGETFEGDDDAAGNGETFEGDVGDDANGETFEGEDAAAGNGETFEGDDDATGKDIEGDWDW